MSKERSMLALIKLAIRDYHHALDTRQHGGVACDECLTKIQNILGMTWVQGADLKSYEEEGKNG